MLKVCDLWLFMCFLYIFFCIGVILILFMKWDGLLGNKSYKFLGEKCFFFCFLNFIVSYCLDMSEVMLGICLVLMMGIINFFIKY